MNDQERREHLEDLADMCEHIPELPEALRFYARDESQPCPYDYYENPVTPTGTIGLYPKCRATLKFDSGKILHWDLEQRRFTDISTMLGKWEPPGRMRAEDEIYWKVKGLEHPRLRDNAEAQAALHALRWALGWQEEPDGMGR